MVLMCISEQHLAVCHWCHALTPAYRRIWPCTLHGWASIDRQAAKLKKHVKNEMRLVVPPAYKSVIAQLEAHKAWRQDGHTGMRSRLLREEPPAAGRLQVRRQRRAPRCGRPRMRHPLYRPRWQHPRAWRSCFGPPCTQQSGWVRRLGRPSKALWGISRCPGACQLLLKSLYSPDWQTVV